MRMSEKRRQKLYDAIHEAVMVARIRLKLPAKDDHVVAQVVDKIWADQKNVLNLQ